MGSWPMNTPLLPSSLLPQPTRPPNPTSTPPAPRPSIPQSISQLTPIIVRLSPIPKIRTPAALKISVVRPRKPKSSQETPIDVQTNLHDTENAWDFFNAKQYKPVINTAERVQPAETEFEDLIMEEERVVSQAKMALDVTLYGDITIDQNDLKVGGEEMLLDNDCDQVESGDIACSQYGRSQHPKLKRGWSLAFSGLSEEEISTKIRVYRPLPFMRDDSGVYMEVTDNSDQDNEMLL